ncbi:MAG: tetratricopeptide repeat protein [Bacteroidetes bacterium]|nr:tetratricopeptide repeat protein [Bacteroidota bacterium]
MFFLNIACSSGHKKKEEPASSKTDSIIIAHDTLKSLKTNYTSDCKEYLKKAKAADSILYKDSDLNKKHAQNAIKAFTDFAYFCSGNDTLAPIFLLKTAQVAQSINNFAQSKVVLETCIDKYPKFKNRAATIFLLAQILSEPGTSNNNDEAIRYYNRVIEDFPKSEWAKNAKVAIKLVGKTDEEIIREFEKKNK